MEEEKTIQKHFWALHRLGCPSSSTPTNWVLLFLHLFVYTANTRSHLWLNLLTRPHREFDPPAAASSTLAGRDEQLMVVMISGGL